MDIDYARLIEKALSSCANVAYDKLVIKLGENWFSKIMSEIDLVDCLIYLISSNSLASENVDKEIRYAVLKGVTVLPVIIEDCDLPKWIQDISYWDMKNSPDEAFKLIQAVGCEEV